MAIQDQTGDEPIYWLRVRPGGDNRADREITTVVNGRKVVEKVPQRARMSDEAGQGQFGGQRWIRVVRHDGHDVRVTMTNGAAHFDMNTSYAAQMRRKARFLGWIPIDACPVQKLLAGEMTEDHFVDKKLLTEQPCVRGSYSASKPCPHLIAERDARRVQNKADWDERAVSYKTEADKIIEAAQLQSKATVEGLTAGLRELAAQMADLRQSSAPPQDRKPRGGGKDSSE